MVELEKTVATAKSALAKGRSKMRTTVADKRVVALKAELKETKETLERSIESAAASDDRAGDALVKLQDAVQVYLRRRETGEGCDGQTSECPGASGQVQEIRW